MASSQRPVSMPGGGQVTSEPEGAAPEERACGDKRGVQLLILAFLGVLFLIPGIFLTAFGKHNLDEAKDDDKEASLAPVVIGPILIVMGAVIVVVIVVLCQLKADDSGKFCKYQCDRHCCKHICSEEEQDETPIYAVDTDMIDRFAPSVMDDMYSESYAQFLEQSGLPDIDGMQLSNFTNERVAVSGGGALVNGVYVDNQPPAVMSRRYSDPVILRVGGADIGHSES